MNKSFVIGIFDGSYLHEIKTVQAQNEEEAVKIGEKLYPNFITIIIDKDD